MVCGEGGNGSVEIPPLERGAMDDKAIERELERIGRSWKVIAQELAECQDRHRLSVLTQELLEALEPDKLRKAEARVSRELCRMGTIRPNLVLTAVYPSELILEPVIAPGEGDRESVREEGGGASTGEGTRHEEGTVRATDRDESRVLG